jgi:hypothetical protein
MKQEDNFISAYEGHAANLRKTVELNKTAVFEALTSANITSVTVEFDGEGDSGGIEHISASRGDKSTKLPTVSIPCHQAHFGDDESTLTQQTLREVVETLYYDCLAQDNEGWENNDGAFGTFTFDVASRTIELEFNGRYSEVFTSTYEF